MNVVDILLQHVFAVMCQQKYYNFLYQWLAKHSIMYTTFSNTHKHTYTHTHKGSSDKEACDAFVSARKLTISGQHNSHYLQQPQKLQTQELYLRKSTLVSLFQMFSL